MGAEEKMVRKNITFDTELTDVGFRKKDFELLIKIYSNKKRELRKLEGVIIFLLSNYKKSIKDGDWT